LVEAAREKIEIRFPIDTAQESHQWIAIHILDSVTGPEKSGRSKRARAGGKKNDFRPRPIEITPERGLKAASWCFAMTVELPAI
jgi:hypothetical protein